MTSATSISEAPKRLQAVVDAPGYASRALDVIQQVSEASDEGEVLEALYIAKAALGAEHAVFVSFIRDDDSYESFRFLMAADPAWCLRYQQQGWFANDPWLLYAMSNSEPVPDGAIAVRTKAQREGRALAAQYGTMSAYIVPAPASGGLSRLGVLILGSGQPGYFDGPATRSLKVLARSLAMELHEWWVRQIRMELIATNRLSMEDLQLLAWERQGKGTKEIANALGSSVSSIDSRFQRLNAKFNKPSRKATARVAAEYGLI
jgi:DNA-binding CsgD family transcriptional regulator